jgi:hypothetical protein
MMRSLASGMAIAVSLAVVSARQQPASTATVSGMIVADDAGNTPVGRAVVTLTGSAGRPALLVVADDTGRFVFPDLPAGKFTLAASKPPYLPAAYGQKTPGKGTGVPMSVEAGQQLTGVVLKLPRGAVITGRVVDARGQPVQGSLILIQQAHVVDGERKLTDVRGSTPATDAQGFYRATGLAAGDYYLCAFPPGNAGVLIPDLYRPGGPELRQVAPAEMQWALQQVAGDRNAVAPTGGTPQTAPPPSPVVAYGPLYYPGTSDPSAAAAVTVGVGEDRGGVDIALRFQRTARIDGRVLGADGQPAKNVSMSIRIGSSNAGYQSADGTFSVTNLLPGKVGITAQLRESGLWASTEVSVNGENVSGLLLTLQPAVSLSGRVTFEATTLQPPSDLTPLRLMMRPWPSTAQLVSIPVRADGTFQVMTIIPGGYRLMAATGPGIGVQVGAAPGTPAWRLKSVTIGGRDVTDVPFDIGAGGAADIVFTFSDRATELSGRLTDAAGQPAPGYYIVVFSTDRTFWRQGRRLPTPARTATDGQYRIAGLPAGEYYVAAIPEFDPADLSDDAVLSQLVASAVKLTLADGEKKAQELRIKGGG